MPQPGCRTGHLGTALSTMPLCCAGARATTVHGAGRTPKGIYFLPPKRESSGMWMPEGNQWHVDARGMGKGRGGVCDGSAVSIRARSRGWRRTISTGQGHIGASPNTQHPTFWNHGLPESERIHLWEASQPSCVGVRWVRLGQVTSGDPFQPTHIGGHHKVQ